MATGKRAADDNGTPGKRLRLQLHPLTPSRMAIYSKATLAPPLIEPSVTPSTNAKNSSYSAKSDSWGEDTDSEFLLLASQACDDIEKSNVYEPINSSILKNNLNQNIFAPLNANTDNSVSGDIQAFLSKKSLSNTDNQLLSQFQAMKKENESLKLKQMELESSSLTKDGEISILRTQLKTCQTQLSIAKKEKISNVEKAQMEFSQKIKQTNDELFNIKSQTEFKALEIVNLKEKCRLLESSRMKFIEPTSSALDTSKWFGVSQKFNSSISKTEHTTKQFVSTKENSAQAHISHKLKLCPSSQLCYPLKERIDNCIFNESNLENPIIFNSYENSQLMVHSSFFSARETILGDVAEPNILKKSKKPNQKDITIDYIYEDLSELMKTPTKGLHSDDSVKHALKIALVAKEFLLKTFNQLEKLLTKVSVKTLREMDEKYIDATNVHTDLFTDKKHLDENVWFNDEQAVETRRIMGLLAVLCEHIKPLAHYVLGLKNIEISDSLFFENCQRDLKLTMKYNENKQNILDSYLDIILEICKIVRKINCSHLYSGLFSSVCAVLVSCVKNSDNFNTIYKKMFDVVKEIFMLRPHIIIIKHISPLLGHVKNQDFLELFCNKSDKGNIKPNYGEGVATYNDDTCFLQLLCNIIEVWFVHFTRDEHMETLFFITHNLLILIGHCNAGNLMWRKCDIQYKCNCSIRLNRCICSCLQRCATLYYEHYQCMQDVDLLKSCKTKMRLGIMVLSFCNIKDIEFFSCLNDYEDHCQMFVHICDELEDELHLQDIHRDALAKLKRDSAEDNQLSILDISDDPTAFEETFKSFSIID
ncbi:mutagen-sensitive 304 [Arctopsyche grandis]|uniref:mutagen-sensitive 304 n=1 Tax=Arctopsyche grandis TaxID=121162 RepID=UPI00406D94F0